MTQNNLRFVAHIDILGMSELVARDAELAWQVLSDLVEARNHVNNFELTFLDTDERTPVRAQVHCVTFSDTIVLFSKSDTLIDLRTILVVTTEMFNKALSTCIPIRVGIAHGKFFFNLDDSMYAGPALIEAYRLGERAQWIGLAASEAVYLRAQEADLKSRSANIVVEADIPIDSGSYIGYAVNWPEILERHPHVTVPITIAQFYSAFEHLFGPFSALPARVQAKYVNSVRFFNTRVAAT
ncbi:MAG: hypothetical protein B7X94_01990 [Hydrogenophilales bacterium 17-62-8]|nr:MAG: hypothetical protein B7X94_01990 [Hydrogenophilales bacterium 17-62-8]